MEEDRMSELPDEILSHIQSFLSVSDAFALKLLSHRYTHLQVPLSNLYFNRKTMFGSKQLGFDFRHVSEFIEKVDWFLSLFKGPYLNTFSVKFGLDNECCCSIDNWVSFAVSMKALTIDLDFKAVPVKKTNLYKFPFPSIVSRLKHLKLSSCDLSLLLTMTPDCSGLNCLETLELKSLAFDQAILDAAMCCCLNLEWLMVEDCEMPLRLRVNGGESLRGLRFFQFGDQRKRFIELNAARLQAFEVICMSLELLFLVVPPLERVHFGFRGWYMEKRLFDLIPEIRPKIQSLSLSWFSLNNIPARIPEFSCLKELEFFSTQYMEFDLLSIANLLNACPMLQKFHLAMCYCFRRECGEKEVVYWENKKHLHLEEINISGFGGTQNQMEFVKYLLNNTIALKHMTLIYSMWKSCKYEWRNVVDRRAKLMNEKHFHDSLRKEMISHEAELIIR